MRTDANLIAGLPSLPPTANIAREHPNRSAIRAIAPHAPTEFRALKRQPPHTTNALRTLLWAAGAIALFALCYALISADYAAQAQQAAAATPTPVAPQDDDGAAGQDDGSAGGVSGQDDGGSAGGASGARRL